MRFELMTSSLPRKRSTPELHWLLNLSGRRGSNPRPSAWKADALPTELLPHTFGYKNSGESRIRTYEGVRQQIYSLPQLATLVSPHTFKSFKKLILIEPMEGFEPPTSWLQISCSGQLSYIGNTSIPFLIGNPECVSFRLGLQRYVLNFNPPNIFEKKFNFF